MKLKKLEGYGDAIGINGDIHGDASFLKIEDFWIVKERWSIDHARNITSFPRLFLSPEKSRYFPEILLVNKFWKNRFDLSKNTDQLIMPVI